MTNFNLIVLSAVASMALPASASAQTPERGKALFAAECSACHSVVPGQNGIGPSLGSIYGKRAGTVPGFKFSTEMRTSHIVWTDAELNKFLTDPNNALFGTKMPTPGTEMHMGTPSAADRGSLIAYLRSLPRS